MKIVHVGTLTFDIDTAVLEEYGQRSMEGPAIKVHTPCGTFGPFSQKEESDEYAALREYIHALPELRVQTLRQLRENPESPFIDEQTTTIFRLFQSLDGSNRLILLFHDDEAGGIWMEDEQNQTHKNALVSWHSFDEAVAKVQALKRK